MIKVIAADDEQYMRNAISKLVPWEEYGCDLIKIVKNGVELLEACQEIHPDIVVTDIRMPLMDGIEACKFLYTNSPEIKLVVLSAYSDFAYVKASLKYDVEEYILKTDVVDELPVVIKRIVEEINSDNMALEINKEDDKDLFSKMSEYVVAHYREQFTLEEVADLLHSNPSYLSRLYKKNAGINFFDDIIKKRIDKARECLLLTNMKINDIAEYVGFNDPSYFSRMFKKRTGTSPREYRQNRNE